MSTAEKHDLKLKPISASGIAHALAKVTHYRYLNESEEAESICRDVVATDPANQQGLKLLGLVITDQFTGGMKDRYNEALDCFSKLTDTYERTYYTGIAHERRAKAQLKQGHATRSLLSGFHEAMRCFEEAEKIRPAGNDDSVLRWNRCLRLVHSLTGEPDAEEGFDVSDSAPL